MGHLSQHRVKWLLLANLKERRFDESTVYSQFLSVIYSKKVIDIVTLGVELPIQRPSILKTAARMRLKAPSSLPILSKMVQITASGMGDNK